MKIQKRYSITLFFLLIFSLSFSQNEKAIVKESNEIHKLKSSEKNPLNIDDSGVEVDSKKSSKPTPTLSPYSVTPINSENIKVKDSKTNTNKKVELKSHAIYNSEEKVVNELNKKKQNETN